MIKLNLSKNYLYLTIAFLLAFILFRLFMAGGNFSYFSVFGKNYTNANLTPFNAYVIEGDGYDGQFFTRYAIKPHLHLKKQPMALQLMSHCIEISVFFTQWWFGF
jgi:hypothetical protein